jgi:hypothetical protein
LLKLRNNLWCAATHFIAEVAQQLPKVRFEETNFFDKHSGYNGNGCCRGFPPQFPYLNVDNDCAALAVCPILT